MGVEQIQGFLDPNALILIPALWILGFFLKQSPKVPDWLIVWVVLTVGILGSLFLISTDVAGVVQGVLAAGASVLGYDLFKQTMKAKE